MNYLYRTIFSAAATAVILASPLSADDRDINLNGDFRNATASAIPGWKIQGQYLLIPDDDGEYKLKLTAADAPALIVSDIYTVEGRSVKLEAEVRGSGKAKFLINCFDESKKQFTTLEKNFTASLLKRDFKALFTLPVKTRYITVALLSMPGSEIIFSDVEAEFKQLHSVTAATAKYVPSRDTQIKQNLPAAPADPLLGDRTYALSQLSDHPYQVTLTPGSDFDFDLREDIGKGKIWTLSRCDGNICRVKIEHERDGIWPFRYEKAEVEIKALRTGKTTLILTHPDKRLIIEVTVL